MPIVLVTLLDADRQHFKAALGVDGITGTERRHAFCNYTILHDEVFVVPDALKNGSFASNPYVTGEPRIRFYAGAPLATEHGIRLGSLCIIDMEPRDMAQHETAILAGLSRLVIDELWLHHLEQTGRVHPSFASAPAARTELDFHLQKPPKGSQIRTARALLNWSVRELAEASGVSAMTIKRIEAQGADAVRKESLDAVLQALEDAGIEFIFKPDAKFGLQWQDTGRS